MPTNFLMLNTGNTTDENTRENLMNNTKGKVEYNCDGHISYIKFI